MVRRIDQQDRRSIWSAACGALFVGDSEALCQDVISQVVFVESKLGGETTRVGRSRWRRVNLVWNYIPSQINNSVKSRSE